MMTPPSQSPSPYPFAPPPPPPPHGAATPGGYDAALPGTQPTMPSYGQYGYGAYPGPQVKVRPKGCRIVFLWPSPEYLSYFLFHILE